MSQVGQITPIGSYRGSLEIYHDQDQADIRGAGSTAEVIVAGNIGSIATTKWIGGKIKAKTVQKLVTTGQRVRRGIKVLDDDGNFQAEVILSGSANPRLMTVASASIAGDLTNSQWNVTGNVSTFMVRGTAQDSRLQTTGDIRSLLLGASENSNFLAGIRQDVDDAFAQNINDFVNQNAKIWTIRILGLRGEKPITRYVTNTHFTAGAFGGVTLLNLTEKLNEFQGVHVFGTENNVRFIRHTDLADRDNSWYWQPPRLPEGSNNSPVDVIV